MPEQHWHCPKCGLDDVTHIPAGTVAQRMHACSAFAGLTVPMLPAGVKADLRAVERQDYIGGELVQVDANGRPVMAVVTTREDGQDCTVYAPTAIARTQ
jgi:hypothetical protein